MNNKYNKLAIDFSCEYKSPISEKDKNLVQRHKEVCDTLNAIYAQKNKAYGDSFSETYREFGNISALTRMSDKWNRIKNLSLKNLDKINDESLIDSCVDLANYLIMYVMEIQRGKNEKN